ncbi:MAG: SdrD B-like domain-containing protein [Saprospiraceae bacterium]
MYSLFNLVRNCIVVLLCMTISQLAMSARHKILPIAFEFKGVHPGVALDSTSIIFSDNPKFSFLDPLIIHCPSQPTTIYQCRTAVPNAAIDTIQFKLLGGSIISFCDSLNISSVDSWNIGGGCAFDTLKLTRTYKLKDSKDSVLCALIYSVVDTTSPTVTCPPNITLSCESFNSPVVTGMATATDNCFGFAASILHHDYIESGDCVNSYFITRTWTARDICSNSSNCAQFITVKDTTPPSITCSAGTNLSCTLEIPIPNLNSVITSDNCAGTVMVSYIKDSIANQTCTNRYSLIRIYEAKDICGNKNRCTQTFQINDQTGPGINCPSTVNISCAFEVPNPTPNNVISNDFCGGPVTVIHLKDSIFSQTCINRYTIRRTFRSTDICGNSSTCNQTIRVMDFVAPVLTCPIDVVVTCANDVPVANINEAIADDFCGQDVKLTHQGDLITNQTGENKFLLIRTYRARDTCGNFVDCEQQITVLDDTAPTITCPADLTVNCAGEVPTPDEDLVFTTDNCSDTLTIAFISDVVTNIISPNQYEITRTYRSTDGSGNSITCLQTINVSDFTPPVITCPNNLSFKCASEVPIADVNGIAAFDNCLGAVKVEYGGDVVTVQICPNRFSITRSYRATDVSGNVKTCVQTISVFDQIIPLITCPIDLNVDCSADIPVPNPGTLVASDFCLGIVTIAHVGDSIINRICKDRYTVFRTYKATDVCGNFALCTQIIQADDRIAPSIVCPQNLTINCHDSSDPVATGMPITNDHCGASVQQNFTDQRTNGNCQDQYLISRTWTATDSCGNVNRCVQSITVQDTNRPVINCPINITIQCQDANAPANVGSATATDLCSPFPLVINFNDIIIPGNCSGNYIISRSWTATDRCANATTCIQEIAVIDTAKPILICPLGVTINCEQSTNPVNTGNVTATDNCTPLITNIVFQDNIVTGICANTFTIQRRWMATDNCGNSNFCIQQINVQDTTRPSFVIPQNITISCADDIDDLAITGNYLSAVDLCSAVTVDYTDKIDLSGCNGSGEIRRSWTATDLCGNANTQVQIITVSCPKFDLALRKTQVSSGNVKYGDTIHFKITVVNQGCESAQDILITDYMTPGYTFLPAINLNWLIHGDLMQTTIPGPILPNDTSFVIIKLRINPLINTGALSWVNIAEISKAKDFNGLDPDDIDSKYDTIPGNDMGGIPFSSFDDFLDGNGLDDIDASDIQLPVVQDIALRKTIASAGPFLTGTDVPFEITVFNQGNVPLDQIVIEDYFPNGFSFDNAVNLDWTKLNDSTLRTTINSSLLPGESAIIPLILKVIQPSVKHSKSWLNYAEVISAIGFGGIPIVDADSNLGSNSSKEKSLLQSSVDNNNIFGNAKLNNSDEDDHDVEGFSVGTKLGDFVWLDLNDNGIQDPLELGVPDIKINLYNDEGILVRKDTTDANGFYEFDELDPGHYLILVSLGSLSTTHYFGKRDIGLNGALDSDVSSAGTSGIIDLQGGVVYDSLDIALVPFTQLCGLVWNDKNVNGIRDPGEELIKNVVVALFDAKTKQQLKITLTDGNGKYIFPKLKTGSYYIKVTPPTNSKFTLPNVGSDLTDSDIDQSNGICTSTSLDLKTGPTPGTLDAGIYYCSSITGIVWNDVNYNHVFNLGEKGINGLNVQLFNALNNQLVASTITGPKPGTPSDDGYYIFDCITPGRYFVKFWRPVNYYFGQAYKTSNPLYDSDVTKAFGTGTTDALNLAQGTIIVGINAALSRNPGGGGLIKQDDGNLLNDFATSENSDSDILTAENSEHENMLLEVYPVPANNELFIGIHQTKSFPFAIRIYDLNSKQVYFKLIRNESECQDLKRFDLSSFSPGQYRILVQQGSKKLSKDFMIVR